MSDDQDQGEAEDVEICEIVITAPDAEWLATFCRSLIEDRLAAAVHIIEKIRTLYRWQGEVHDTHEARAHLRTRKSHTNEILERAQTEHPYEVPSVIAFRLEPVNSDYHKWLLSETKGQGLRAPLTWDLPGRNLAP